MFKFAPGACSGAQAGAASAPWSLFFFVRSEALRDTVENMQLLVYQLYYNIIHISYTPTIYSVVFIDLSYIYKCLTITTVNFRILFTSKRSSIFFSYHLTQPIPITTPALGSHKSIVYFYRFPCSWLSYSWNHIICGLLWLTSLTYYNGKHAS